MARSVVCKDGNGEKQMSDIPITVPRDGLFKVSRTSHTYSKPQPCYAAMVLYFKKVDRRQVDDPSKVQFYKGDTSWWYDVGSNHRVENGCICRDMGTAKDWFIEITDIMDFVRKHGECVVSIDDDGFNCIEIYDYYRE